MALLQVGAYNKSLLLSSLSLRDKEKKRQKHKHISDMQLLESPYTQPHSGERKRGDNRTHQALIDSLGLFLSLRIQLAVIPSAASSMPGLFKDCLGISHAPHSRRTISAGV